MAGEIAVPTLPCASIKDILEFYGALGFVATYQQLNPNPYAVVQYGDLHLHFFGMKELKPEDSYSTCIVIVPDAEQLRGKFVAGLRQHYGKLPAVGIPRLTRLRHKSDGGRGFNIIDPGGNWIRIVDNQQISQSDKDQILQKLGTNKLSRAIVASTFMAEKGDTEAAIVILDKGFVDDESAPAFHRVLARVSRAGMAITLGDLELARKLLSELRDIALTDEESHALKDEFLQVIEFEEILS